MSDATESEEDLNRYIIEDIRRRALPLEARGDVNSLVDRMKGARFVLMGEASHGTSDFYRWRAHISKDLILKGGFRYIAVEGDWPDTYLVNRFVKGRADMGEDARNVLSGAYKRWPTWMWANEEVLEFVTWLRNHNQTLPEEKKVGFFGLDVYSLWESIAVLRSYLKRHDPQSMGAIEDVINCFEPFGQDPHDYARATFYGSKNCSVPVKELLQDLERRVELKQYGEEQYFQAIQNAHVLVNAEAYYRAMVQRGANSWNIRDTHMADTLGRLAKFHGPGSKGIVWEHNTHIGDSRYTDMIKSGEINIGQIVRERYGEDAVFLLGFSTYKGTVIAGRNWDSPMRKMTVPPGHKGSWEELLHEASAENKILVFDRSPNSDQLNARRGHRAIGVVYHPEMEAYGNYVTTVLSRRYDALLYIEESRALHPLHIRPLHAGALAETYPSAY